MMQPVKPTPTALVVAGAAVLAVTVAVGVGRQGAVPPVPQPAVVYPAGVLPNPALSPGDVLPTVTTSDVCVRGYAKSARNVPESEKDAVYREYGIDPRNHAPAEIDHIISLELGGSNDIRNLFPEPYSVNVGGMEMGAHEKDKAEDATHAAVCAGKITLADAQKQIRTDWTVLYRRFVSETFPAWKGN